jgi:hypothetical protein
MIKLASFQRLKDGSNPCIKSLIITEHTNIIKDKNLMVISIDPEESI